MRNENTLRRVLLLSAIIALLLMALIFDFIIAVLQVQNSQGAGLEPVLVVLFSLFELLLVLGGMGVFWYLVSSGERSRLVSWSFLVGGLLVLFGTPLLYFLPVPMTMLALVEFIQPGTYVFQTGAVLAVIGMFSLFIKPVPQVAHEETALTVEPAEPEV
jgi:hypothetical protein